MKKTTALLCAFAVATMTLSLTSITAHGASEFKIQSGVLLEYNSNASTVTIPEGVTEIEDSAFESNNNIKSVTFPSSLKVIGKRAFANCESLQSVTIPKGVTQIRDEAFYFCKSLSGIEVDAGNPNYSSQDGILYNKDKTILVQYPGGKKETSFAIPSTVTAIGTGAISYSETLTSITIPDSVTEIHNKAFKYCEALTSVTLPDSVTTLGEDAFKYCKSLQSIQLSKNLEKIKMATFKYCESLEKIVIPDSVPALGKWLSNTAIIYNPSHLGNKLLPLKWMLSNIASPYSGLTSLHR